MRRHVIALALISTTSWLVACGTDPVPSASQSKDGGAGSTTTGSGGGGSGLGGSVVTTGGGGNGGSAVGGSGGAAGSAGGNGGTAGTPVIEAGPAVSLCDGKPKKALPYAISGDFRAVTVIGAESTFAVASNPDCTTAYPNPEAGTDAAGADSADETAAVDANAADGTTADVSTSDATTSDAAPVDAGPPAPACFEFHYDPALCEAGTCWAGVIFQPGTTAPPPDAAINNTTLGICIQTGATKIDFMARATREGARIKFGSIREGMGATEFFLNVTTQWAMYTVGIPAAEPYNDPATSTTGGVWNGFSVVVEPQDHVGGTTIEVKDMTWK